MLVMMATEDHLQKGAVMDIAKRLTWHAAQFTDYGNVQSTCMPWA